MTDEEFRAKTKKYIELTWQVGTKSVREEIRVLIDEVTELEEELLTELDKEKA